MSQLETFASGNPLDYALRGVKELSSSQRRANKTLENPIKERYGTQVSQETARVLEQLYSANDGQELVAALKAAGLDEVEDYGALLDGLDVEVNSDEPDLGDVMGLLDVRLTEALCPRETEASKVSTKSNRESIYIPELVNKAGDGTVYMAKTLSSVGKVRMAWDLHDDNQVVVVDDYEKWERLLGWEKLKQFPHGKNKIREELGDRLSPEVLEIVAGEQAGDTETKADDSDSSSRGRRTRTKPSEEVLNLARGSRHKLRRKMQSKDIAEAFEDDEEVGYHIEQLVLFPTTCDLNMTDHWWIPGDRGDGTQCAIANCNKGTFEYLNQYEQVWHVEDYLEQASDYEFDTNAGPITMGTASTDNLVLHIVTREMKDRLMRDDILREMPGALHRYCEEELYSPPDLPHEDDMVYAAIDTHDVFWLRPALRKQVDPSEGDALIATGGTTPRDLVKTSSISSDFKLYARARLPDWDFYSTEMQCLEDASSLYMDLDEGAAELLETLGKLHDQGKQPFSETPEARWS